jgi:DNA-binding PadR family transcriptional regulator
MASDARLKPHWFHILVALSERDRHGADIVRHVEAQTDGRVRLWPVMLQTALGQLAAQDLIEATDTPAGESERRQYYRLTRAGRRAAAAEADRLAAIARQAKLALRGRP